MPRHRWTSLVPSAHTIAPTRGRETTTADAPTGPTHPTSFVFARFVAHTMPPTRDRETTTPDAQSAAMTAALTGAAGTNAPVTNAPDTDVAITNPTAIGSAVTVWEVTTAAVEPQVQAGTDAKDAPEVMYTLRARTATAPAREHDRKPQTPQTPQNEDTSVASVKTPQNTDASQPSEHAKAAKSGP